MKKQYLPEILAANSYPGRGIALGSSQSGSHAVVVYFIMGRSQNSRNRVFTEKEGGIITEAADPALLKDPSLIIYAPVRRAGRRTIVTNGNQTDTIYDCLTAGLSFEHALRTRTFEPDMPNFTPRISGMLTQDLDTFFYQLSILKSDDGNAKSAQRFFFDYPQPQPGTGHFIHTYITDESPLPSFEGEPRPIVIKGDIDEFAGSVWQSLNPENKISLFVRYIGLDGSLETRIFNRYQKV